MGNLKKNERNFENKYENVEKIIQEILEKKVKI